MRGVAASYFNLTSNAEVRTLSAQQHDTRKQPWQAAGEITNPADCAAAAGSAASWCNKKT